MQRLIVACLLILVVSACVRHSRPSEAVRADEIRAAWAGIIGEMAALEARRATRAEWRAAAQFEDPIQNRRDLALVMRGLGLRNLAEAEAVALYQNSAAAAHFGFPANFHALVFFDAGGRSLRVLR